MNGLGELEPLIVIIDEWPGRAAEVRPYLERFLREAPPPLYGRDFPKVRAWLGTAPPA